MTFHKTSPSPFVAFVNVGPAEKCCNVLYSL